LDKLKPKVKIADQFKSAKTIKEAEDFAIKNGITKKVNYGNATLEEANIINKELNRIKRSDIKLDELKIEKIKGFIEGDVNAVRDDAIMTIDIDRIKYSHKNKLSLPDSIKKRINRTKKELQEYRDLEYLDDIKRLENRLAVESNELNHTPKYWSAADNADTFNDRVKMVIDHEYTHAIQSSTKVLDGKTRYKISEYYSNALSDEKFFNKNYTKYAATEWNEFWAESYSLYKNGLLKDEKMIKLLKELE